MTSQHTSSPSDAGQWDAFNDVATARKGHLMLSMQWARNRTTDDVAQHLAAIGGSDMEAREFAHGLVGAMRDCMSRRDLRTVALMFLLELERRNQDTPNPQEITAIQSAVARIARQVDHTSPRMDDLPLAESPIKLYELTSWRKDSEPMTLVSGERVGIIGRNDMSNGAYWHAATAPKGAISLVDKCYRETEHRSDGGHELDTHFMFQAMDPGAATLRFNLQRGSQVVETIEVKVNIVEFVLPEVAPALTSPLREHNDLPTQDAE